VKFRTSSEMMCFYVYGDVEHCDFKELLLCNSTVREKFQYPMADRPPD
jgi:hypothetical protein